MVADPFLRPFVSHNGTGLLAPHPHVVNIQAARTGLNENASFHHLDSCDIDDFSVRKR